MKKLIVISLLSLGTLSLPIIWATPKTSEKKQSSVEADKNMETKKQTPIWDIKKQSPIVELTAENAQAVITNTPATLIIDFYAEWCGPCKSLKPIFEEVAQELKNTYVFAKINIDQCREVAKKYQITSIPTIGIFSNGKMIEKITGLVSKETLLEKIETALKGPQDLSTLSQVELNEKLIQSIQNVSNIEEIKRLLDAGADVNFAGPNGIMPLMLTIFTYGSRNIDASDLIKLLLSHGASTEFIDQNGQASQAAELATAMSQNLKGMAENYDKMSAILANHKQKKSAACSQESCKI